MIVLNFALNKFMPFILISFLSFYKMGFQCVEPYAIFGLAFFIARFNFKDLCDVKIGAEDYVEIANNCKFIES